MVKLKVIKSYRNRNTQYQEGQVIDVTSSEAAFLIRDAPGCFTPVDTPVDTEYKGFIAPPKDKMARRGKTK